MFLCFFFTPTLTKTSLYRQILFNTIYCSFGGWLFRVPPCINCAARTNHSNDLEDAESEFDEDRFADVGDRKGERIARPSQTNQRVLQPILCLAAIGC